MRYVHHQSLRVHHCRLLSSPWHVENLFRCLGASTRMGLHYVRVCTQELRYVRTRRVETTAELDTPTIALTRIRLNSWHTVRVLGGGDELMQASCPRQDSPQEDHEENSPHTLLSILWPDEETFVANVSM